MKKLIPALLLGAMIWNAAPASAQSGPDHDMRFELTYTPLRISSSDPEGVVHSNMSAITLNGEGRVFQGLMLGGSFTKGGGNNFDLTGVNAIGDPAHIICDDPQYTDFKVYTKIPFNFADFGDSDRTMDPTPAMSPFYGYVGYKNTCLTTKYPSTAAEMGKVNVENSSGFGFGLGAEVKWDPIGIYGQAVYYPCMLTKSVGFEGANDGKLNVWEWDVGVRSNFKESPIQAKIGYHFEQHKASNINLQYDGFQFGIVGEF